MSEVQVIEKLKCITGLNLSPFKDTELLINELFFVHSGGTVVAGSCFYLLLCLVLITACELTV